MEFDTKSAVSAGLAGLGAMALVASGYMTLTTPGEQQCQIDLADQRARLELTVKENEKLHDATDACKIALQSCAGGTP